jgi:hypothetical protein
LLQQQVIVPGAVVEFVAQDHAWAWVMGLLVR